MPGPPPSRNPRRRNARPDWRKLPSGGRVGDPPAWPLAKPAKAVADLWADVWASPQATAWADLGWTRVVARYCKLCVVAERADAPVSLLGEVRQLEDRLGLTPMAMMRLQWEIAAEADSADVPTGVVMLDEYRELYG
jgi:hypothetical protein